MQTAAPCSPSTAPERATLLRTRFLHLHNGPVPLTSEKHGVRAGREVGHRHPRLPERTSPDPPQARYSQEVTLRVT